MAPAAPTQASLASLHARQASLHALRPLGLQVRSGSQGQRARHATAVRCESRHEDTGKATSSNALAGIVLSTSSVALSDSAQAADVEQIRETLQKIDAVSSKVSQLGSSLFSFTSQLVNLGIKAATPVVGQAAQTAVDSVAPLASGAQQELLRAGIDVQPAVSAAKTAAAAVTSPQVTSLVTSAASLDPPVLLAGAVSLLVLYLSAPAIGSGLLYSLRGYAGDFTALQALDVLTTEESVLIDVRSEGQKAAIGVPSLPRAYSKRIIAFPTEPIPDSLASQVRDPLAVQAELTAIQIAALKRLPRKAKILIMDSNNEISRPIARALSSEGFKDVWVVKGGMAGREGWEASLLPVDFYAAPASYSSKTEILSPSRILSSFTPAPPSSSSAPAAPSKDAEVTDTPPQKRRFLLTSGSEE